MNVHATTNRCSDASDLAWFAARKYNDLRGSEGFTPLELWSRQRKYTGETFDPPLEALRRAIQKSRSIARKSHERRQKSMMEPSLNIVEYCPQKYSDYFNDSYTPIKLGDLFLLNATWDKNNSSPYFKVAATDFLPTGLNFDDRLIGARKVGVKETTANAYLFGFDAVRRIIDGNSTEAKEFLKNVHRPSAAPISLNSLFRKDCPYRLRPGLHQYSPSVTWADYEEPVPATGSLDHIEQTVTFSIPDTPAPSAALDRATARARSPAPCPTVPTRTPPQDVNPSGAPSDSILTNQKGSKTHTKSSPREKPSRLTQSTSTTIRDREKSEKQTSAKVSKKLTADRQIASKTNNIISNSNQITTRSKTRKPWK